MYKRIFLLLSIGSLNIFLLGEQQSAFSNQTQTAQVAESAHLEAVLDVVKDREIQTPDIKPPSAFMVWLRSFGISVAYKFYAIKGWIAKRFQKHEEKRA